ncbi:hypothetical protein Mboo_0314 [Methanoregula boonei 6A8]|jgi:hypothetical protein|uniref:Restriction endonuclease type IV Mrr domain-containing protein n=1 Tax=Methanoregula boonei (strain DSM 21154 / JCM 14090 / 6A8) TaxID=456442 RepID=A7I525_METB6|nr:hypothetical protein [Methanoregula boonei]ABS54836.1 hypothetical protein Mboo_0314 [Methanoregula boonei 6A8]
MPTPHEIGKAGEGCAVELFKGKGFTIDKWDTHTLGTANIEAHSREGKILVQVKSAIFDEPSYLSAKEQRNVKALATRIGAVAWEAKVILNTNLDLVGDIRLRQLD